MLIYFVASVSQGKEYAEHYQRIVHILQKNGHKVVFNYKDEEGHQNPEGYPAEARRLYYRNFLQKISKCDMVVAEVSYPSTINIGYAVSISLEKSKPVLALHIKDHASPFLDGVLSDKFLYEEYTLETLESVVERGLRFAEQQSDARFNFFISPKHISFLDFVARKRKIPKSVYLRELIERDKRKNREYVEE